VDKFELHVHVLFHIPLLLSYIVSQLCGHILLECVHCSHSYNHTAAICLQERCW